MLMMIIGMSLLYSYVMSYLHISQSVAELIVAMQLPRWELLAAILVMVVVLGFFLPPVSIILMTAPIILPPLRAAQFDIIWFGIVMTIVMEMGLIHPPVGLNIFVIRNVAPDIPLERGDLGHAAVRAADDAGGAGAVLRAGNFDGAARSGDGAGRGTVDAPPLPRHARSVSDEAIQLALWRCGLLSGACHRAARCADPLARNDGEPTSPPSWNSMLPPRG